MSTQLRTQIYTSLAAACPAKLECVSSQSTHRRANVSTDQCRKQLVRRSSASCGPLPRSHQMRILAFRVLVHCHSLADQRPWPAWTAAALARRMQYVARNRCIRRRSSCPIPLLQYTQSFLHWQSPRGYTSAVCHLQPRQHSIGSIAAGRGGGSVAAEVPSASGSTVSATLASWRALVPSSKSRV